MKKTENISLAGYSFTIEADAYGQLEQYLKDIRQAFDGNEAAEEITADIEERISEILRECCPSGMVVNINMVDNIKKRIGNPEELAGSDVEQDNQEGTEAPATQKTIRKRKLYRNIDERVLGGVCSGLGMYFGIDKVLFRIAFLILFFIGLIGDAETFLTVAVIGYLCLWIAMPAARTVEQKCEMKGKPVNLENYRSKDFELSKEVNDALKSPAGQAFERIGGVFLGVLMIIIGAGGLLSGMFVPAIQHFINAEIMEEILEWGPLEMEEQIISGLVNEHTFWILTLVMMCIMFIWFLYNGVMFTFNLKHPSWKPGLTLFIAWIISVLVLGVWTIKQIADAITLMV